MRRFAFCLLAACTTAAPAPKNDPAPVPTTTTPAPTPTPDPPPKKGSTGATGSTGKTTKPVCTPGETRECSTFPAAGIGRCVAGTETCRSDGSGFDACAGEIGPTIEVCANQIDDDCDGNTDEHQDLDKDGFAECSTANAPADCCDVAGACSSTPELVNAGAFEALGNHVDDDCDPTTPDNAAQTCDPTPLAPSTTARDLARAMDICKDTTATSKAWGLVSATLVKADGSSVTMPATQYGVLADYGPNVMPRLGTTMASIASGNARDESDPGYDGTSVDHLSESALPAVYSTAHNGELQSTPSCKSANDIHDTANLKLVIRAPTNAKAIAFRFKFYSNEWPEWVCSDYNDFFMALLTTGAPMIPADHNISFDAQKNPVSVNNAFFEVCDPTQGQGACPAGTNELVGTGVAGPALDDGGGTRWLETTAPIVAGELLTLELIIWDTGDHAYDSLVLLDDFRFLTNPAGVGTNPD